MSNLVTVLISLSHLKYVDFLGVCLSGLPITCQSRSLDDVRHGLVRLPRHSGRIRLCQSLQKFRRRKVEVERAPYLHALPWVSIRYSRMGGMILA